MLSIFIKVECSLHDDWMSFACWYSIQKLLDAEFYLVLSGKKIPNLFRWTSRAKVKQVHEILWYKTPLMVIQSNTMLIREFTTKEILGKDIIIPEEENLCCSVTENEIYPFVKIDTCGLYERKTWSQTKSPFPYVKKLRKENMSINENAVLNLWGKMKQIYSIMSAK